MPSKTEEGLALRAVADDGSAVLCAVCFLAVGKSSLMLQLLENEFDPMIRYTTNRHTWRPGPAGRGGARG